MSKQNKTYNAEKTIKLHNHWLKKGKSDISGDGLISIRNIPAGILLLEYTGKCITEEEAESTTYKDNRYLLSTESGTIIDGSSESNRAAFINHSCNPNCEAITLNEKAYIKSIHPIKKGEELCYNYNLESYEWIKHCRCPTCRQQKINK